MTFLQAITITTTLAFFLAVFRSQDFRHRDFAQKIPGYLRSTLGKEPFFSHFGQIVNSVKLVEPVFTRSCESQSIHNDKTTNRVGT